MRIDLHNYTIQEAHAVVALYIDDCYNSGDKTLQVITGVSGEIHREFPHWIDLNKKARGCYEVGRGGGMFNVTLKKKK